MSSIDCEPGAWPESAVSSDDDCAVDSEVGSVSGESEARSDCLVVSFSDGSESVLEPSES